MILPIPTSIRRQVLNLSESELRYLLTNIADKLYIPSNRFVSACFEYRDDELLEKTLVSASDWIAFMQWVLEILQEKIYTDDFE